MVPDSASPGCPDCGRLDGHEEGRDRIAAGQTVDGARVRYALQIRSIDSAELDARMLVGAVLGLDLTGLIAAANRLLTPDESIAWRISRAAASAASRSRAFSEHKEFWGLPLQLSAATLVPRPDTETVVELALEMLRAVAPLRSPVAHRRHRHRLRCNSTGAVVRIARCASGSAPTSAWRRLRTASANAARSGAGRSRRFRRLRLCGGAVGPFRSDRLEPALYPLRGDRWTRHRGPRLRPARRARRRRATDSTPTARSFRRRRGCWRRDGVLVVEVGQGQSGDVWRLDDGGRVNAGEALPRPIWRASAGPSPAGNCPHKARLGGKKTTWNIPRERLRSGHNIGPGLLAP